MRDDAKHGSTSAMCFESAAAKNAGRAITVSRTSHIDLAYNAVAEPTSPLPRGNPANLLNLTYKFMPRRAAKIMIAPQNLSISIANPSQPHTHKRPPRPQLRQGLFFHYQLLIVDGEGEHEVLI
jgi:hypothetical protein